MVGIGRGVRLALARLERDAALDAKAVEMAFQRLTQIADTWHEIELSALVRENSVAPALPGSMR
jgi:hypothetical protein